MTAAENNAANTPQPSPAAGIRCTDIVLRFGMTLLCLLLVAFAAPFVAIGFLWMTASDGLKAGKWLYERANKYYKDDLAQNASDELPRAGGNKR